MARGERLPRSQWPAQRRKWAEHIAEWATGSLSQAEYCRRKNLDEKTFSGWKRRFGWRTKAVSPRQCSKELGAPVKAGGGAAAGLGQLSRRKQVVSPQRPEGGVLSGKEKELGPERRRLAVEGAQVFVPLRVAKAQSDTGAFLAEVVLRNGRVLRVGKGADPAVVGRLAAALEWEGAPC
jgi:hypothetical protein